MALRISAEILIEQAGILGRGGEVWSEVRNG